MSVAYAHSLLQRGMGVQDAVILSGCSPDLVRAMRPVREEYSAYRGLETYGPPKLTRGQKITATIKVVALRRGVSVEDIMVGDRTRPNVNARHEAMYLLRRNFGLSYPRIGAIMGRDHTTVMNGVRAHAARIGVKWERKIKRVPAWLATGWDYGREGGK